MLEDDLRTTIVDVRNDYACQRKERETFYERWKDLRTTIIIPAFNKAIPVFEEFGWQCQKDYSNGLASLELGEIAESGEKSWLYKLLLKPDMARQKIEVRVLADSIKRAGIVELDAAEMDKILTGFARRAEEELGKSKLPA
jgi:hypothetical protein